MLRTIFFDLDDTILDFRRAEAEALSKTLLRFDLDPAPAVLERYHVINAAQWKLLEEGKITRPQVLLGRFIILLEELGFHGSPQAVCDVYEAHLGQGHFFLPGAPELLAELAPQYDLYLATNGTAHIQRSRLESAQIAPYFKGIFISQEMGANKPSLAFFHACFDAIPGFDPALSLMVGDSLSSDIRGARSAGLRTCWFNPHGDPPQPEIPADYEIKALEELPELLKIL